MIKRLLIMAGVAVAGWLLGVAGQAHADTVPGARLPSDVAQPVAAIAAHVPVVPAVRTARTVLAPARPPAILALPPAVAPAKTGAPRPRTPAGTAGPSRTRRHGAAGHRQVAGYRHAGGPLIHIGSHAVTGASEKASTRPVPALPRPQPPTRTKTLPAGSGVDQIGVRRTIEPGTARRRPAIPNVRPGAVPPAVRTAADEPSFSPD